MVVLLNKGGDNTKACMKLNVGGTGERVLKRQAIQNRINYWNIIYRIIKKKWTAGILMVAGPLSFLTNCVWRMIELKANTLVDVSIHYKFYS